MKHKFFALCFLIGTCFTARSQNEPVPQKMVKPKTFTIKLKTGNQMNTGYLAGIDDSLIQLSARRVAFSNSLMENSFYKTYNYADVVEVKIRKYGSVGKGVAFGGLAGAATGALIGLITYQKSDPQSPLGSLFDFGPGFNAIVGAGIGVIPGIIIGGIIASKMKKFIIHRNKEKFNEMRTSVLEMSLNK